MTVSTRKKPVKRGRTRKAASNPIVDPAPQPTPIPGPDHDNVIDPDYGVPAEIPSTPSKDGILVKLSRLRGFDFVVLPLIYLEAFVVNILQNADINVPDSVRIK